MPRTRTRPPSPAPVSTFRHARALAGIVRQIVDRCHVGQLSEEVEAYASSRLVSGAPLEVHRIVRRLARIIHAQNVRQYRRVMWGAR